MPFDFQAHHRPDDPPDRAHLSLRSALLDAEMRECAERAPHLHFNLSCGRAIAIRCSKDREVDE